MSDLSQRECVWALLAVSTFEWGQAGAYGTVLVFPFDRLPEEELRGIVGRQVGAFDLYIVDSVRKNGRKRGGG